MEILTFLDDHSRYALSVTAHTRVTGPIVLTAFRQAVTRHGTPASTLTDNGMVSHHPPVRRQRRPQRRRTRAACARCDPEELPTHHPTTCGKVERFQQTLKKWLRGQPHQPATLTQLHTFLDAFTDAYNHHRPHRSLPQRATPATAYQARPTATPHSRDADTHWRTRTDRVDNAGSVTLRHHGRLHHIGIGRTHARTRVILLIADLNIRVINAATGQLIRELVLNPTKDYQPTGRPPGPQPKRPRTQ